MYAQPRQINASKIQAFHHEKLGGRLILYFDCERDIGQPIVSGDYTLKAVVYAKDGRPPTVLTTRVTIQLPDG